MQPPVGASGLEAKKFCCSSTNRKSSGTQYHLAPFSVSRSPGCWGEPHPPRPSRTDYDQPAGSCSFAANCEPRPRRWTKHISFTPPSERQQAATPQQKGNAAAARLPSFLPSRKAARTHRLIGGICRGGCFAAVSF